MGGTPSQVWTGGGNPIPGPDGGYPIPGPDRGYPIPGLDGERVPHSADGGYPHPKSGQGGYPGVPPIQDWMGYPCLRLDGYPSPIQDWMGYPQTGWDTALSKTGWGTPSPSKTGWGTPPPISKASSCYSAGGVPLAFTQEDFLVIDNNSWEPTPYPRDPWHFHNPDISRPRHPSHHFDPGIIDLPNNWHPIDPYIPESPALFTAPDIHATRLPKALHSLVEFCAQAAQDHLAVSLLMLTTTDKSYSRSRWPSTSIHFRAKSFHACWHLKQFYQLKLNSRESRDFVNHADSGEIVQFEFSAGTKILLNRKMNALSRSFFNKSTYRKMPKWFK